MFCKRRECGGNSPFRHYFDAIWQAAGDIASPNPFARLDTEKVLT